MKKLTLMLALLLIIVACNKEKQQQMEKVGVVENKKPELSITSNIAVLKKDNNSNALFFISNISNQDTIKITFQEPYTAKDFIVTKGYPMDNAYGISIKPINKSTSAYAFTVQVINHENKEILNEYVYFFALKKLYPAYADNNMTPMSDEDIVIFNKDVKEQYVILNQIEEENYTIIEDKKYNDKATKVIAPIKEYGFSNKFTGSLKENTNGIYKIDNQNKEFVINNQIYNNCIVGSGIRSNYPCALKITSSGEKSNAIFYLSLDNSYIDTTIKLKTE